MRILANGSSNLIGNASHYFEVRINGVHVYGMGTSATMLSFAWTIELQYRGNGVWSSFVIDPTNPTGGTPPLISHSFVSVGIPLSAVTVELRVSKGLLEGVYTAGEFMVIYDKD